MTVGTERNRIGWRRTNIRRIAREIIGGLAAPPLPPHLADAVRRQDRSSEVLIRLIQLGIVIAFGALYLLSPRTDANTAFTLVPYALVLYLGLTLFGLAWALRSELPAWAVQASIVFDIALLMALIWSFHVQYEQPAAFYLKIPTFLYVFIFIAVRALRFEPVFVLSAGLTASAAWLGMLAFAISTGEGRNAITRDFVRYLTSNSVLIGAEIDKVLSVLVVTGVLWLALRRARRLLVQAATERLAATNLSRFFDDSIAARIRDSQDAGAFSRGVRRDASILFVDVRGFTPFSAAREPSEAMAVLTEYQRRIVPLIQAHGGVIDKFLGDGIMATFGAAEVSPTHAADALRAIDAIMAEVEEWPVSAEPLSGLPPRPIGAAAATGPVIFGAVGDGRRLEFTVIGSPVNLAAKLEKENKTLGCRALATLETYEAARRQGYAPKANVESVEMSVGGSELSAVILHA